MANVDKPNGFTPVKSLLGAPWNSLMRKVSVAARSDATNNHGDIYVGDPINISDAGVVTVADSGDAVTGVVVGIGSSSGVHHGGAGIFDVSDLTKQYIAHDAAGTLWYVPANGVLFSVQTASDLDLSPGEKADTTVTAATAHGSRTTSRSTAELTTASNNDVMVVEDDTSPNNDVSIANARHLVMFLSVTTTQ
jgi:hypothetical protein